MSTEVPAAAAEILSLQQTVGNKAVAALVAEPGEFIQRCGGTPPDACPCHGVQRKETAAGSASWPLEGVAHAIQRGRLIPASQTVAREPRRVPIASGGSGERVPIASGGSGIRGTPVGKAGVVDQDDPGGKRGGTGVKLLDEPEGALLDRLEDNTKVTVVEEMPGHWYHVVAQDGRAGYVKGQFVDFPPGGDPEASLYRITAQDKVGLYKLLSQLYGPFEERALLKLQLGDWGWDARFYANVVVHVNKEARRAYVTGPFEKVVRTESFPGYRVETDYTMMKDKRIWLPGKTYADTLHGTVPSGSTSYGVVEKARKLWSIIREVAPFVAGLLVGAVEHLWNMVADIAKMIWGLFKSLITGTILSDARVFVKALWDMIKDPKKLLDAILGSLKEQWDKGWYERGKLIGMFLVEALIMILTFGSATAARATGWVKKLWDLLKTTKAGAALARLENAAAVQKASKVAQAVKARFAATAGAVGSATTSGVRKTWKQIREQFTERRVKALAATFRAIARFAERLKKLAQEIFKKFGFKRFEVEVEGDWIVLYGIRSKIMLARFKKDSIEKYKHDPRLAKALREQRERLLKRARRLEEDAAKARKAGNRTRAKDLQEEANHIRGGKVAPTSEAIGERAAAAALKRKLTKANRRYTGHGRDTVDAVFDLGGGKLAIVEAKGGKGRLITRKIGPGVEAQQGTIAYLRSLLKDMKKKGGRHEKMAEEIEKALDAGKLQYFLSETPIGPGGLTTTLGEFVVPK